MGLVNGQGGGFGYWSWPQEKQLIELLSLPRKQKTIYRIPNLLEQGLRANPASTLLP